MSEDKRKESSVSTFQLAHIGTEVLVIGGVGFLLWKRTQQLEAQIDALKLELVQVAKYVALVEANHAKAIDVVLKQLQEVQTYLGVQHPKRKDRVYTQDEVKAMLTSREEPQERHRQPPTPHSFKLSKPTTTMRSTQEDPPVKIVKEVVPTRREPMEDEVDAALSRGSMEDVKDRAKRMQMEAGVED